MKNKILKNIDWGILICSVILLAVGMVALFSSTQNSNYSEFIKQGKWIGAKIGYIALREGFINDSGYIKIDWIRFEKT